MEGLIRDGVADATELVFLSSGTSTCGEYRCAGCGYGVTVFTALPRCPMCSGETWEETAGRPLARAFEPGRLPSS